MYYFEMFGSQPELIITISIHLPEFSLFLVPFSTDDDVSRPLLDSEIDYRPLSNSTDDVQAWSVARQWLQNCLTEHPECSKSKDESKYPTRLIFISPVEPQASRSADVRLQVSAIKEPHGPYFTLSHCWGKSQITTLTTTNLGSMQTTINFESLPRTFQDAILFARFCGIQYLWIDSLCIIQDSEDDWEKESKTMADVYTRSCCNINATASEDSHGGCFHLRDPMLVNPLQVYLHGNKHGALMSGDYICARGMLWAVDVDCAPLSRRAWVLQEHLLSPRQLHCGRRQLFWHCRESRACETFPHAMPTYRDYNNLIETIIDDRVFFINSLCGDFTNLVPMVTKPPFLHYTLKLDTLQKATERNQDRSKFIWDYSKLKLEQASMEMYASWCSLVAEYSGRALSNKTDKLFAILGIINHIEELTLDQNFAGLWQSRLNQEILWKVDRRITVVEPAGEALPMPSWSWASVNKAINPYNGGFKLERINIAQLSIIDDRTKDEKSSKKHLKSDNLYQIRMRCYLYHSSYKKHVEVDNTYQVRFHVEGETYVLEVASENFDSNSCPEANGVVLTPIIKSTYRGRPAFDALLLESTEEEFYRRVGVLQLYDDDWHSSLSRLSRAIGKQIADHPEYCTEVILI